MKENILIVAACAMLLSISSVAHSAEGFYVGGNVGAAIPVDVDQTSTGLPGVPATMESDTGIAAGIALGYDFGNNFRVEVEYAYQQNDMDKFTLQGVLLPITSGDITTHAGLLNGYYDFANSSPFTPFISAGVGMANVEHSAWSRAGAPYITTPSDDTVFAYQASAGVGFAVTPTVTIDVKYRYFGTEDLELTYPAVTITSEHSSHNFYAGVRVAF